MSISDSNCQDQLEEKFLETLRYHLSGLRSKAENEFSKSNFNHELSKLKTDPVYPKFALDSPEYVLIRFMGRVSISIGRRLGEIYDRLPRFIAAARFDLSQEQVAPKLNGLELDIGLRFSYIDREDVCYIRKVVKKHLHHTESGNGIGIEIRYNFNPNDSTRLRKDVDMAGYLQAEKLLPIYLVFSAISPRHEAIARLKRAGWNFLIGDLAIDFAKELLGLDLARILDKPKIKAEVRRAVNEIMVTIFKSYAFQKIAARYKE